MPQKAHLLIVDDDPNTLGSLARAFRLAELNYDAGALDFLGVLDAQRSLVAVDAALAASTQQVALDQVAVFKALGGGWQRQGQRKPVIDVNGP